MRALRFLAVMFLIGGGALTCRAGYVRAKAELAGTLIRRAWKHHLQSGKPEAPWPGADLRPIARLRIPRLGYDEIVLEGATPTTLAFGPTYMLNGAGFGEQGNLLLAGHRTNWFLPLQRIRRGDEIRVVDPSKTALLAPTGEEALTLVTCYPFGSAAHSPQRFIVRALPSQAKR